MTAARGREPLVSVVLPAHNAAAYLDSCLSSLASQTFSDFEVVLIDDGSTDGTRQIAQAWADRDGRIRPYSRESRGLAHTLNEGIELSRGEWIARMDADDICLPHRLRAQLDCLKAHAASICGGGMRVFGGGRRERDFRHPTDEKAIKTQLLFDTPFVHPSVVARRDLLLKYKYDYAFRCAEDYELWTRISLSGARMVNTPEIVLRYRRHPEQVSAIASDAQTASRLRAARIYRRSLSLPPIDDRVFDRMLDIGGRPTPTEVQEAADAFKLLIERAPALGFSGEVIARNAVLFFVRHHDVGIRQMISHLRGLPAPMLDRLAIAALTVAKLRPGGKIYELAKKLR